MDPIADLITRIKNASAARKGSVSMPYSKMKEAVLVVLEKEGYIGSIEKKGKQIFKTLEIGLVYDQFGPKIKGAERISKLSKRVYSGTKDIKRIKQGQGIMLISSPKGIVTDSEARKQKVGGELLFKMW